MMENLSQIPKNQGQYLLTNRPGENRLVDVINGKLIPTQLL